MSASTGRLTLLMHPNGSLPPKIWGFATGNSGTVNFWGNHKNVQLKSISPSTQKTSLHTVMQSKLDKGYVSLLDMELYELQEDSVLQGSLKSLSIWLMMEKGNHLTPGGVPGHASILDALELLLGQVASFIQTNPIERKLANAFVSNGTGFTLPPKKETASTEDKAAARELTKVLKQSEKAMLANSTKTHLVDMDW